MAIGAHRRLPVALGDGLSVDALLKLLRDRVVALAAGWRHIELEDRRLGILRVENLVSAVAIGADRGFLGSVRDRVSMNALLVRSDHLRALAAILPSRISGCGTRRRSRECWCDARATSDRWPATVRAGCRGNRRMWRRCVLPPCTALA